MPAFPATPDARSRNVRQFDLDSSATFKLGAAVLLASDEEIEECGTDPRSIRGFSAEPAAKDPESGKILVACCDQGEKFWLSGDNAPVAGDLNQTYGIVRDSDGIWTVDGTDTSNTAVYVHQVDLTRSLYLVSVLEGVRQAAA